MNVELERVIDAALFICSLRFNNDVLNAAIEELDTALAALMKAEKATDGTKYQFAHLRRLREWEKLGITE